MSDSLAQARLATQLQKRIDALYTDRCADDDISAPVLDLILESFVKVGELVEERLSKEIPNAEIPKQTTRDKRRTVPRKGASRGRKDPRGARN